jgi:hypothetical protein
MVLPTPGGPSRADVGLGLDEGQRGQVADLANVEIGLEGEIELLQGLVVGQPGQLERVAEPAGLAQPELLLEQQVEEVQVAHALALGAGGELVDDLAEVGQPEPAGVAADPGGDQLVHRPPSALWFGRAARW